MPNARLDGEGGINDNAKVANRKEGVDVDPFVSMDEPLPLWTEVLAEESLKAKIKKSETKVYLTLVVKWWVLSGVEISQSLSNFLGM